MQVILFGIALSTLIGLIFIFIEFKIGFRSIKNLSSQPLLQETKLPSVTIIFSALNEAVAIKNALQSMLDLSYPRLNIIAVNDRSTDETPIILNQFQTQPRLKVQHIQRLTKGWLGKNHALHVASMEAKGEWLLFTDADVTMKADALQKAMSYAIEHQLDHLTIYEHHLRKGFWLKMLLLTSYYTYSLSMRPWRVRHSWSKKYLGHGAFNLVRKTAYQQAGGHQAIALECLDDLKLGRLIKQHGFKQDTVDGRDFIEREWYSSLSEMIKGFQKNAFAFFNFSFLTFLRDFILTIIFYFLPCIVIFSYRGPLQWLNIANIFLTYLTVSEVAKHFRVQKRLAIFYPLGFGMLFYTLWNSVISTYKHNGVIWRDTFYSLQELRYKK